jgi:hypothetical protein
MRTAFALGALALFTTLDYPSFKLKITKGSSKKAKKYIKKVFIDFEFTFFMLDNDQQVYKKL